MRGRVRETGARRVVQRPAGRECFAWTRRKEGEYLSCTAWLLEGVADSLNMGSVDGL